MRAGRDQGGIQRDDRGDTGDLEARPKDGEDPGVEDLTVKDATDPDLGLTGIGDVPAQDWAADTGPTRTGEGASHGVDRRLAERDRAPSGRRIDFDKTNRK